MTETKSTSFGKVIFGISIGIFIMCGAMYFTVERGKVHPKSFWMSYVNEVSNESAKALGLPFSDAISYERVNSIIKSNFPNSRLTISSGELSHLREPIIRDRKVVTFKIRFDHNEEVVFALTSIAKRQLPKTQKFVESTMLFYKFYLENGVVMPFRSAGSSNKETVNVVATNDANDLFLFIYGKIDHRTMSQILLQTTNMKFLYGADVSKANQE